MRLWIKLINLIFSKQKEWNVKSIYAFYFWIDVFVQCILSWLASFGCNNNNYYYYHRINICEDVERECTHDVILCSRTTHVPFPQQEHIPNWFLLCADTHVHIDRLRNSSYLNVLYAVWVQIRIYIWSCRNHLWMCHVSSCLLHIFWDGNMKSITFCATKWISYELWHRCYKEIVSEYIHIDIPSVNWCLINSHNPTFFHQNGSTLYPPTQKKKYIERRITTSLMITNLIHVLIHEIGRIQPERNR